MAKDVNDKNQDLPKPLNKKLLILAIIFVIVVAVVAWLLVRSAGGKESGQVEGAKEEAQAEEEQAKTVPESKYFSAEAKIMFFYADGCGWCSKQKQILGELGYEGYRFKPMNVGNDTSLWEKYEISGTPTFIGPSGDRLIGYREKDELKAWIDKQLK